MIKINPTQDIDISFNNYILNRQKKYANHLENGIPDYSFALDHIARQKINATPGVYRFFKALTNTIVPRARQEINMTGLKVSSMQYSHIYDMAVECADRLGIGIPTVYIKPEISILNAYTYAIEDEDPIIIINSSLIERFTEGELKAVIGHECGHIHNNHGIYNIAAETIINQGLGNIPIVSQILSLLSYPLQLMILSWSRAAEITCDRAGMICSDDPMDEVTSHIKFLHGGMLDAQEASIEQALKQYDSLRKTPVRFLELASTHPTSHRRALAALEFKNSELLYKWRPEWKNPDMDLLNKQELDMRCQKYVGVVKSEVR